MLLLALSGSVICHPLLAYASLGLVDPHNTWQNQQKKTHPVGYWLRLEQTWRKLWRLMQTVKMSSTYKTTSTKSSQPGSKTSETSFEQMRIAKAPCENNGGSLEFLGKSNRIRQLWVNSFSSTSSCQLASGLQEGMRKGHFLEFPSVWNHQHRPGRHLSVQQSAPSYVALAWLPRYGKQSDKKKGKTSWWFQPSWKNIL